MVCSPEQPKWDQNLKFTPLSKTTSIPVCFTRESPLGFALRLVLTQRHKATLKWPIGDTVKTSKQIYCKHNRNLLKSQLVGVWPAGYLIGKSGRVDSRRTKHKFSQWQGEGFELGTSRSHIRCPKPPGHTASTNIAHVRILYPWETTWTLLEDSTSPNSLQEKKLL